MSRTSPPYTAVIFTGVRGPDQRGYDVMSARMVDLAAAQPGFLGIDSVRDGDRSITVSYWAGHRDAAAWKEVAEHRIAQERGRSTWYRDYTVRVATVDREYGRDG